MYKMRQYVLVSALSALSVSVIANAFYQKEQFYPAVIYLQKSNPSLAVSLFGPSFLLYALPILSAPDIYLRCGGWSE